MMPFQVHTHAMHVGLGHTRLGWRRAIVIIVQWVNSKQVRAALHVHSVLRENIKEMRVPAHAYYVMQDISLQQTVKNFK